MLQTIFHQHVELELELELELAYHHKPGLADDSCLIFLHGAGEKGAPIQQFAHSSIVEALQQNKPTWHCYQPICPSHLTSWPQLELTHFIKHIRQSISPKSIVLAGISMGARGVYEFLATQPDLIDGACCIAGIGIANLADHFKHKPLLIAHSETDNVVPFYYATDMKAAVPAATWLNLEQAGHNCLAQVLTHSLFWEFLDQFDKT